VAENGSRRPRFVVAVDDGDQLVNGRAGALF
jgi:hypothetical protein